MGQELSCCSSDAAQNTFVPFVASALPDLAPFVLADKRLHAVVLGDFNPAEHQQVPGHEYVTVKRGDKVTVVEEGDKWSLVQLRFGAKTSGWIPTEYVKKDSERKRKQKRKQPKSVPAALFDEFDVKRTGILGRTELRALIASVCWTLDDASVDEMVAAYLRRIAEHDTSTNTTYSVDPIDDDETPAMVTKADFVEWCAARRFDVELPELISRIENNDPALLELMPEVPDRSRIGEEHAERIAEALLFNSTIVTMNFSLCNAIGQPGIVALSTCLERNLPCVRNFVLSSCSLDDEAAKLICGCLLINVTCESIDLSNNRITQASVSHFGNMIAGNSTLRELDLSTNHIRDMVPAASDIDALRRNDTLRSLNLGGNPIIHSGLASLAAQLEENSGLKKLNLRGVKSMEPGIAAALAAASSSCKLIFDDHITPQAATKPSPEPPAAMFTAKVPQPEATRHTVTPPGMAAVPTALRLAAVEEPELEKTSSSASAQGLELKFDEAGNLLNVGPSKRNLLAHAEKAATPKERSNHGRTPPVETPSSPEHESQGHTATPALSPSEDPEGTALARTRQIEALRLRKIQLQQRVRAATRLIGRAPPKKAPPPVPLATVGTPPLRPSISPAATAAIDARKRELAIKKQQLELKRREHASKLDALRGGR